jgi:hypothetical protein
VGYVTDLRSEPLGLFAAYFDVTYNPSVAKVNGPIARGDSFQRVLSGNTSTAGLIDEVGGTGEITLLDGERYMVFSVPMKATGTGKANFASNPADILPAHQVLLFGINDPIGSDQIVYGKSELFVRNFTNPSQPLDSNGDGFISPIDALLIVNELNTIGGRTLSKTLALEKVPSFFADVNGDGALSPIDALVVINKLNSIKRGEGENPNDVPVPLVDVPLIDRAEIASAFLADDLNGEKTERTDSKHRQATDDILADESDWA